MTGISQSALLQALGWATLNSFWQAGLLWCVFALARRWRIVSPSQQYIYSVIALALSFLCFAGSFWFYLLPANQPAFQLPFLESGKAWLPAILTAASITYLLLLFFPVLRLAQNWVLLRRLRTKGLHKANVRYRLYVQKISGHMGIKKPVQVFLSALIHSPVTIGFLKPLILLPVASFNQLTLQQAEAVLLHELAHIRRHDYLVNIAISFIHTILYFNPFVRLFIRTAEGGREECCDGMVLQFGYDRMAYASALLQLEKTASPLPLLALGATGKNQLLSRVEAIVGLPRAKPLLRMQHFTGLLASVLCIFALHSLFISGKKLSLPDNFYTFSQFGNPFNFVNELGGEQLVQKKTDSKKAITRTNEYVSALEEPAFPPEPALAEPALEHLVQVAELEDPVLALTPEAQKQVEVTIQTTQKVLSTLEWQQVEKSIGDALTAHEKEQVRKEYMTEINQIDWKNLADQMASQYAVTDWQQLNAYVQEANHELQADSAVKAYTIALQQLDAAQKSREQLALPDLSVHELNQVKATLKRTRDSLMRLKERSVIKL